LLMVLFKNIEQGAMNDDFRSSLLIIPKSKFLVRYFKSIN